ncbi:hypothetical protein Vretimale_5564 [Volvox reticuliferus]|uniref:Uncharacterized protein n=1 Tax=Volvox reticuliferus TaxID=1737510 RepID=A0A8J4LKN1_9CHLO|nr:hypothetical protein Vretimale_5564 [Volvox reticuliferus]
MSMTPLPVHMSCFGVSSDAVNMVRGYSKPSYSDRLASVRNSIATGCPDIGSLASNNNPSGPLSSGGRAVAQASSSRQAPQVKLQPLTFDQALSSGTAAGGGQASSAAAAATPNSSLYRATTKHVKTVTPTLQALDFISIAVNSVGGGGVPRPYGKFQACRAGDGNATWERLPPPPGSWQARALPIAVTLLGDSPPYGSPPRSDSSPPPRQQRSGSTGRVGGGGSSGAASSLQRPLHGSAPAAAAGAGHRTGRDATRIRLSLTPPETSGNFSRGHGHGHTRSRSRTYPGPGAPASHGEPGHARDAGKLSTGKVVGAVPAVLGPGTYEQSYYRRPGSSLHRSLVPLPPPEPHNLAAWFALPAATFLAEVPDVPDQLRMDNGFSVSRDFLMSGLNPPRRLPPPSPPRSSTQQSPSYPQPHPQQQHPDFPQLYPTHSSGRHSLPHLPDARPEDTSAIWNALGANAVASSATSVVAQSSAAKLRGVYVPLEKRPPEPSAESPYPPPGTEPLLLMVETPRNVLNFPPETSLPRRNEPSGW